MINRVILKPARAYVVRTPEGDLLPDDGLEVVLNTYWRRRLDAGDVVEVKRKEAKK